MTKKIAFICGHALGRCMKFYLFSMLPTVWLWFPVLCIAGLFDIMITLIKEEIKNDYKMV